jgi:hypothetical protein
MRKITVIALSVSLICFSSVSETSAAVKKLKNKDLPKPTLAILDTSIDSSLPIFKDKIIQEVCILEWNTCPNETSFMEGPGSASMTSMMFGSETFSHGTAMASVALKTNSDINIVFIRIIGQSVNGSRQSTSPKTIVDALFWVFDNKDKYNIKAVSMSQGSHSFKSSGINYCNEKTGVEIAVKLLLDYEIPSFFAAGNEGDRHRINWPACIKESISIGSATKNGLSSYTNSDSNNLDFYADGSITAIMPEGIEKNIIGTSVSTQVAAAQWLDLKMYNPNLKTQNIYNLFYKTAIKVKNGSKYVRLINLKGAING